MFRHCRRPVGLLLLTSGLLLSGGRLRGADPEPVRVAARGRPELVFACDRPTDQLDGLFTPVVVADLVALHAGVALSTEDFSAARAAAAERLEHAGIPLTAWLVLPRDQGYYVNTDNAGATADQYAAFDRWSRAHDLHWAAIGLDIEPSLTEFAALQDHRARLVALLLRRACDGGRVVRARADYATLIRRMQAGGYRVQTYQLPFIADERAAHTTLLERVLGLVDVRGDEEVLMLYSSFNHQSGAGMLWAYGPAAQAIAVGSTARSGDAAADALMPPLNWEEFSRDVVVAAHFSRTVGVYSLEGCVQQGFLPRLRTLDWSAPVVLPAAAIERAGAFRARVHRGLWLGSHLPWLAGGSLLLVGAGVGLWGRRRRHRRAVAA